MVHCHAEYGKNDMSSYKLLYNVFENFVIGCLLIIIIGVALSLQISNSLVIQYGLLTSSIYILFELARYRMWFWIAGAIIAFEMVYNLGWTFH